MKYFKMKLKKIPLRKFEEIYSKVPKLCVEIVLKEKQGILFTKRKITPWKGFWHFPGGTVLLFETIKHAINRVAKEELNLKIKINKLLGIAEYFNKKRGYRHAVSLIFLAERVSGKLKLDFQASESKFFKEIPKGIVAEHRKVLKRNFKDFLKS
jgi:ADP-ribose pyrophosphatase YjhB (NUDIX family)